MQPGPDLEAEGSHSLRAAATAIVLIDRLVHHAEILTIDGDSYRRRVAEAKRKSPRPTAES